MAKGSNKQRPSDGQRGNGPSPIEIAQIGIHAVDSICIIIQKIGEERRKTEEMYTERARIHADLEIKLSEMENETAQKLGQYQIELQKIVSDTKIAEINANKEIAHRHDLHEEQMLRIQTDHARRMRQLDIIEKIVDATLAQYVSYQNYVVIAPVEPGGTPIINLQMLDAMNSAIDKLNGTLSQACLDAPLN